MSAPETSTENQYEKYLSLDNDPELREQYQVEAQALALYSHFKELGRRKDREPVLHQGDTKISIPAFFALPRYNANPVNNAALGLLPEFSYKAGYGNTTDVSVNRNNLRDILNLPDDSLEAARWGKSLQYILADGLGFLDHRVRTSLYEAHFSSSSRNLQHYYDIDTFVGGIAQDLDDGIVADVSEIAAMVKDKDYRDFFDYLVDAKEIIDSRVETLFSHPANSDFIETR